MFAFGSGNCVLICFELVRRARIISWTILSANHEYNTLYCMMIRECSSRNRIFRMGLNGVVDIYCSGSD